MQSELAQPTGSITAFPFTIPETTASTLARSAEQLHREAALLHGGTAQLRRDLLGGDLEARTYAQTKRGVMQLLSELREAGFSWRDVAKVSQVSVPAVQKWRRGEGVTAQNHQRVARLCALLQLLRERLISDPVSWLEMPVLDTVLLTRMDMLAANRPDLVLELASDEFSPVAIEPIIDRFDPAWRHKYVEQNFETFLDFEGVVAIRSKA